MSTLITLKVLLGDDVEVTDDLNIIDHNSRLNWTDGKHGGKPDPKENPFVLIPMRDWLKIQEVFDELDCREKIRETEARVMTLDMDNVWGVRRFNGS